MRHPHHSAKLDQAQRPGMFTNARIGSFVGRELALEYVVNFR